MQELQHLSSTRCSQHRACQLQSLTGAWQLLFASVDVVLDAAATSGPSIADLHCAVEVL